MCAVPAARVRERPGALTCLRPPQWNGQRGPWARWSAVESQDHPGAFFYSNVGHANQGRTVYLAEAGGELVASATPMAFELVAATEERAAEQATQAAAVAPPPVYTLTAA